MNRKFIAIFGALLFLSVGATIAFNSDSMLFPNVFHPATTKTSVIETFVAPTDWLPCQTADKVITVRNDGNVPVAARIKIAESWKDKDGNELALTFTDTNGATQRLALININTADWEKRGAYYYYKTDLAPDETSTPFMTDVTLNCAANLVDTPYLGGTYTLSAAIQTIEAEHQNEWTRGATLLPGPEVNAKLKKLAGDPESAGVSYNDQAIKTIVNAESLPENFNTSDSKNIISVADSEPIYAWFDNTNNAGIIYLYTDSPAIRGNADMSRIFQKMRSLVNAPAITSWIMSDVTSLRCIFYDAISLTSLDISGWDTSSVTDMAGVFATLTSLTHIEVSDWDTSNVTTMNGMFYGSNALVSLDLSGWDTPNVTDMYTMFYMCSSLVSVDVTGWDTSSVIDMTGMFAGASSLSSIDVSGWDTSSVTSMFAMFNACQSLTSIDVSGWETPNVTNMSYMFDGCKSLTNIDVSGWETTNVTDMSRMFNGCQSLIGIDVSGWETPNVTDMSRMFANARLLTSLNVSSWDTSKVTNMNGMFSVGENYVGNGQLAEIIGLENFDTSNVTNMTTMFYGAGQMTHYNISGWNVSKVESFNHMFCDNFKLESLDLSGWDVSSVKTMYNMFDDARSLTTLGDISHWSTTSLIDAGGFLNGATSFVGDNGALDLSGWDTSNLLAAGEMFRETPLTTIDIRGWDFSKLTNDSWEGTGSGIYYETGNTSRYIGLSGMFLNMPNLQNVYIDQDGKDSFDAAAARGVNVDKFWQGSPISDFTVLSN